MSAQARLADGFEDAAMVLMDRVKNLAAAYVTQASLYSIVYRVDEYANQEDAEKCESGSEILTAQSLVVASTIYDTLQTAAPWNSTADTLGYNMRFTLPKTARTNGNKWHRVEAILTPLSGASPDPDNAFPVVWIIETKAMGGT